MRLTTTCVVLMVAAAAACGGGSSNTPAGKVRVLNLVSLDGGPGATLDIYASGDNVFGDDTQPANAVPLISNLAFGQASDYVTLFDRPGNQGQLSYYLAGKKDAASCLYGCTPPSGFKIGDQASILFGVNKDSIGKLSAAATTVYEHGATELPKPASGHAMMVGIWGTMPWLFNSVEYSSGGPCLTFTADSQSINGGAGYELDAGTLQLELHSTSTFDCSATTKVAGPTAVTLKPDEIRMVVPYGTSTTDVHLLALDVK